MNRQQVVQSGQQARPRRAYTPRLRDAVMALAVGAMLCPVLPPFGLTAATGTSQVSKPVQEYIWQLESSYRDVKTLKAEFTQTYIADGRSRVESGTVYFARGGRMRWDYREPEEKLFLSDGKNILLYVPAEKQLTRSAAKSSEDARVPFRLLLSRLNLRRVFGRIEFADQALKPQPGNEILHALPKREEEGNFQEVFFELTPAFDIRKLVIRYPDHSSMQFTFNAIDRNVQLSPALFRFTPPVGTEVIDQSASDQQ